MLILVLGGSKSGKSSYAEKLIQEWEVAHKYYLATMKNDTKEAKETVERHRKMREGKGFETIEKSVSVNEIEVERDSVILLECVGNLCANEMFSEKYTEDVTEKIVNDMIELEKKTKLLVVVSNLVDGDGIFYDSEVDAYIKNMGNINRKLSEMAKETIEVVYGIPICR